VIVADAELIARTVLACPAVDTLDTGAPGSVATYLPGRRITGVSVDDRAVTVQVRMAWGSSVAALTEQVRGAVLPIAGGRRIDISVSDIALPSDGDGRAGIPPPSA
jgi:hypothetical protein